VTEALGTVLIADQRILKKHGTDIAAKSFELDALASRRATNHGAFSECTGKVNWKIAPFGMLALAHNRPPCASTIERQIERPIPIPPGLVV
jgi:hypothetical protein